MLKLIKEFKTYVLIAGFKKVKLKNIEHFLKTVKKKEPSNVEAQFFDAKLIATWQHIYFATLNALTAFKNKTQISKSLAMEAMVYASTQRQIKKATELLGIKESTTEIAVLLLGENRESLEKFLDNIQKILGGERDDAVLKISKEKEEIIQKVFGISEEEIETVMKRNNRKKALVDLMIERMALLATQH